MKIVFNQIIAFILMYAVMLQFFGQLNTVIHYELNKQELTDLYCINKDTPELSCFARCYLKTKLEKHDTSHESNLPTKSQLKFLPLYISDLQKLIPFTVATNNFVKHRFMYIQLNDRLRNRKYFHPPIG